MQKKDGQRVYEQCDASLHVGLNEALARIERLEQLVTPLSCEGAAPSRDSGTVAAGPSSLGPISQGSYPSKELANGAGAFREEAEARNGELSKAELAKQRNEKLWQEWELGGRNGPAPAPGWAYTSEYLRGFEAAKTLLSLTAPKGHVVLSETELQKREEEILELKRRLDASVEYGKRMYDSSFEKAEKLAKTKALLTEYQTAANKALEELSDTLVKSAKTQAHLDKALAELADASEREKALTSKLEQVRAESASWKEAAMNISARPPMKKDLPLDKVQAKWNSIWTPDSGEAIFLEGARCAWRLAHE